MTRAYTIERWIKIILLIYFILVSCKSDHDPMEPIPEPQHCSLKSQQNNSLLYTITRNDKGLPVMLDFESPNSVHITSNIEYNEADHIVKMTQENSYFIYEYDEEERVISRELFIRNDSSVPYHSVNNTLYRYNEHGQIDSAIYDIYNYDRYEYDASGNVVKNYFKSFNDPEVLVTEYLSFDDKKNPASDCNFDVFTILTSSVEHQAGLSLPWISDHNVLSKNVRLVNGSVVNHTYSFQYNELGYPTFCNETGIVFSYNCK